jgi:hypothetical protein
MAPDYLCTQAESLIKTLSGAATASPSVTASSPEAIVDGYAHVLALDVDRLRLEREIARLAESGDPRVAGELRDLSVLLRRVRSTSEQLRNQLSAARAQAELAG